MSGHLPGCHIPPAQGQAWPVTMTSSPLIRQILTLHQWCNDFMETWLRFNLFINYIQVKHLLKKADIICSLSSVGKELTSNADK